MNYKVSAQYHPIHTFTRRYGLEAVNTVAVRNCDFICKLMGTLQLAVLSFLIENFSTNPPKFVL